MLLHAFDGTVSRLVRDDERFEHSDESALCAYPAQGSKLLSPSTTQRTESSCFDELNSKFHVTSFSSSTITPTNMG